MDGKWMMDKKIVNEGTYPIQKRLIWSSLLCLILALLIIRFSGFLSFFSFEFPSWGMKDKAEIEAAYFLIIAAVSILTFFSVILKRANFYYSCENTFLVIRQGIFSKREIHIPYGVIQDVIINKNFFDRFFGMATLLVENAARGSGKERMTAQRRGSIKVPIRDIKEHISGAIIGFNGYQLRIPGLAPDDATDLKFFILQKMKENPMADNTSGL
jgi:membrane protein YdbS with pleckstrin-like domain